MNADHEFGRVVSQFTHIKVHNLGHINVSLPNLCVGAYTELSMI